MVPLLETILKIRSRASKYTVTIQEIGNFRQLTRDAAIDKIR